MTQNFPIQMKEVINLTQAGFDPGLIKLGTLSFESDQFICAKEIINGHANVVVCDVKTNFAISKRKISAEGVMMHPTMNVMAVRAKNPQNAIILQVYNLDTKVKMKDIIINYEVVFWKWLNDSTIGIVTTTSVLLLSIDDVNVPAKKIFDRQGPLATPNVFIMNLLCDPLLQWFTLSAVTSTEGPQGQPMVVGYIQLYNSQQNVSQPIEGFCPAFGSVKCIDDTPLSLLSFIDKKANNPNYKLMIRDLAPNKRVKVGSDIQVVAETDFPVLMNFVENFGLIFLATNSGTLYIYEVTKGILIFRCKISEETLLFSAKNTATGGIIYINKSGKVDNVDVEKNNFIPFMMNFCKNIPNIMELCTQMAGRYGLPGAENIFLGLFKNYMTNSNYVEAAKICRNTPGTTLRNLETTVRHCLK